MVAGLVAKHSDTVRVGFRPFPRANGVLYQAENPT